MGYIIGTDEAGYGPNLGPLVIAATVWHVAGDLHQADLYAFLADAVTVEPAVAQRGGRLLLADSKRVYRAGDGLDRLECGVLAALSAWQTLPSNWSGVWQALAPGALTELALQPWLLDYDCPLPVAATSVDLNEACTRLAISLAASPARLVAQRARVVFPREFNARLAERCNKAELLSRVTLELAGELLASLDAEPVWLVCDKHGGRNRYQALLQRQFPNALVVPRGETAQHSRYQWLDGGRRVEACFQVGAECHLPVALASMTAKYLRELAMRAFNDWWRRKVPGLAPTAGYPVDAVRFRRDIADQQRALAIDDALLWRNR